MLMAAALAALTPSAFGQYPYPSAPPGYGPPPMPYAPPGYGQMPYAPPGYGQMPYAPPGYGPMPMPMPMYGQPPMPMPMYGQPPMPNYAPAPMWQPPRPTVYVYGPLTDPDAPPARPPVKPAPVKPAPVKSASQQPFPTVAKNAPAKGDPSMKASTGVTQVQATVPSGAPVQPSGVKQAQCGMGDSCGIYGCGDCCPDAGCCDPIALPRAPLYGHGHWIGEVGSYFLVPYYTAHPAYTTTNTAGTSTTTDFPQSADFGERVSIGYLFHNSWGIRANYWYLQGSNNSSVANSDPATTITTAMPAPFQSVSPGLALQNGLGTDQFSFQQRLNINVADVEVMKEFQMLDTTFLVSFGGRYARVHQAYSATRNNAGGTNALDTVTIDRDNLDAVSDFDGWGPTASLEVIHPLGKSRFAIYANLRGSALWGINRFSQDLVQQQASVSNTGVPTFLNNNFASDVQEHREVTLVEAEIGLQYGCRFGRCYVFGRAGAVYQRWFDVGNPTSATGDITFLGGTAQIGITY